MRRNFSEANQKELLQYNHPMKKCFVPEYANLKKMKAVIFLSGEIHGRTYSWVTELACVRFINQRAVF